MTVWTALPVPPSLLGESPFWHPDEAALYWCDIAGKRLERYTPASGAQAGWSFDSEPGCCAPLNGGAVLVATRGGLLRLDIRSGAHKRVARVPYDPAFERFNDGRADPQGRFWAATVFEPRTAAAAALWRWQPGKKGFKRMAESFTVGNGIAFSPDGATLYCSDTTSHRIFAFDFDGADGSLSRRRVLAQFEPKAGTSLAGYGGRPDGAAVDSEGCLWVAMYEGAQLLRLAPDGQVLQALPLPLRCPTMPCFGGADLRTLYVTSARHNRPADELAAEPLAGCVLSTKVSVPGLPVNFARE